MLDELFQLQSDLNRRIGFDAAALRRKFDAQLAGIWLNNYIDAASNELEELRNCTFWKHWCAEARQGRRFYLHDLQNARVEVIDLLFFWISLAQCLGLTPADVMELYRQKLGINHQRQDDNYSMTHKTEADNRRVALPRRRRATPVRSAASASAHAALSHGRPRSGNRRTGVARRRRAP